MELTISEKKVLAFFEKTKNSSVKPNINEKDLFYLYNLVNDTKIKKDTFSNICKKLNLFGV